MTAPPAPDAAAAETPVLARVEGRAGHLVLNRPRAINALTHEMVGLLQAALDEWAQDETVQTVVISGAGERGLCAGGDIVALYEDARAGGQDAAAFWADEYRLDATVANYPKPVVALMDGIVLGGGIGLAGHASIRVVTERSTIGMPETGIGFFPDVGGTFLLSRAPGETGTHLALTAGSVRAADAIAVGLADYQVPAASLPALVEALASTDPRQAVLQYAEPAGPAPLAASREWLDECYRSDDPVEILERLGSSTHEDARAAGEVIRTKSPTSVAVTLRALRSAAQLSTVEEVLAQDYRLAVRFHAAPDFVEGIRAQVIDKDRQPRWNPATVEQVDAHVIDDFFAPLTGGELDLTSHHDD